MVITTAGAEPHQPGSPLFVVEPSAPHTHTMLLLHGLGSSGEQFGAELLATAVASSGRSLTALLPHVRFVFPTARRRRARAFGRAMLTQWFDVARVEEPSFREESQRAGLAESAAEIMVIIAEELTRVPPRNLVLGGLSQGCAMALAVLLSLEHPVGGFVGMSGWCPYESGIHMVLEDLGDDDFDPFSRDDDAGQAQGKPVKAQTFERELLCLEAVDEPAMERTAYRTAVFLGHGEADEQVPVRLGEAAAAVVRAAGYTVHWKCYKEQGHWYKLPDEIDDIIEFIADIGWTIEREDISATAAV